MMAVRFILLLVLGFVLTMAVLLIKNSWRGRRVALMKLKPSPAWYGYRLIHQDTYGRVWEILPHKLRRYDRWSSTMRDCMKYQRILEVVDSTKGTQHFLRVPMLQHTSFGKGAVAWTFDMTPDEYNPQAES